MLLFTIRSDNRQFHAPALFFIIFTAAVFLLTSCRGGTESPEKSDAAAFLAPMRIETEAGQGDLYDITGLTSGEDGCVLCSAGLYDETHLLLLRGRRAADGSVSEYTAALIDLCSGTARDLISFDRAALPQGSSENCVSVEVLSCEPLIVHDRENGILYRLGETSDTVILPGYLRDAKPYYLSGRLWLSSDRGILYEITGDGNIVPVWTLPVEYAAFTPVVTGHEGKLSFSTYNRRDPYLSIYVDVDPADGGSEYYLSDINPSRFSVAADGRLLGSSFRTAPAVSVCDLQDHMKKELTLPDEVLTLLDGTGNDASALTFHTLPLSLCGGLCAFVLRDDAEELSRIYLWDTASCRSIAWDGPSESGYAAPETVDYGVESEKAKELEDKYGVRIILGENVPSEFADYSAEPFTEPGTIDGSLSVLENVFSMYPENYFRALKGGYYRGIVFYLTGALKPLNADNNISNAGAFATESEGTMQLAFDLYDDLRPETVVHELTHAADYRFAGEGLFDEDVWNSMNPEGFSYYYSYLDEHGESYETAGSLDNTAMYGCPADEVWFIDPYSKTFPLEDRARLMENLLSGRTPYAYCFSGQHVQEKLSYYFGFLRETLGDDSWPDRTAWEEALLNASS